MIRTTGAETWCSRKQTRGGEWIQDAVWVRASDGSNLEEDHGGRRSEFGDHRRRSPEGSHDCLALQIPDRSTRRRD